MKKFIQLIKTSWAVKRSIKRCLSHERSSAEHQIGQQYKKELNTLDIDKPEALSSFKAQIERHKTEHAQSTDLTTLLSNIEAFIKAAAETTRRG